MESENRLREIIERPTVVDGNHESLYRNYAILDYVEWLLSNDVHSLMILRIVQDLRALPEFETKPIKRGEP